MKPKSVKKPVVTQRKPPKAVVIKPVVKPVPVATAPVAVRATGGKGISLVLVAILLALVAAVVALAVIVARKVGFRSLVPRRQRDATPDVPSWMAREEQWLLSGKHAYLAAEDATAIQEFQQFLTERGVRFVVVRQQGAVVFSQERNPMHRSLAGQAA